MRINEWEKGGSDFTLITELCKGRKKIIEDVRILLEKEENRKHLYMNA